MKRALFVYNARSGKGLVKRKLADILDILVKGGMEVVAHPTQRTGDAKELVRDTAEKYDLVVCAGGDGTLDETVTGMMLSPVNIPIGYIPAGSTNDFGSSLQIPTDILKSARIVTEGIPFPCDIGEFNNDHFVYVAAFGLFTNVSYRTKQELKNIFGHAAYLLEATKELGNIPSYELEVEVNGEIIHDRFSFGMVTNSSSIGGFKDISGKNVELNDGLMEVTLIREPKNQLEFSEIIACLTNLIQESKLVYTCKAESLEIRTQDRISWTLDGEYGGTFADSEIRCKKHAVSFLVEKEL